MSPSACVEHSCSLSIRSMISAPGTLPVAFSGHPSDRRHPSTATTFRGCRAVQASVTSTFPPMKLSRGALRCLAQLQFYARSSGRAFPFQSTLARDLKRDSRTVRRYISELIQTGHIQVHKRQHSSAEYVLSDVLSDVRSGDFILTEVSLSNIKKPVSAEIPAETITTPGGRTTINPAWIRYRDQARRDWRRRA